MLSHVLNAYEDCPDIDGISIVVPKDKLEVVANMVRLYGCSKVRRVVAGGVQRAKSIQNGLKSLDEDVTMVSIHDVSRPCVSSSLISETVKAAKRYGTGISAVRIEDGILEAEKGQKATKSLDRSKMWSTQTPQTYKLEVLQEGLAAAAKKKLTSDDESELVALVTKEMHLVPSTSTNMKVRTANDMVLVSSLLRVI